MVCPALRPQKVIDVNSRYSGPVELSVIEVGENGELTDLQRPETIETVQASGRFFQAVLIFLGIDGARRICETPKTLSMSAGHQGAVDAHYAAVMTYDFYRDVLGRPSLTGRGGHVRLKVSPGEKNAYYMFLRETATEGGMNKTAKLPGDAASGVPTGIGIEKALKIFGRAMLYYLTPDATFAAARAATIDAAKDLFGRDSQEQALVGQAWAAVGVKG